MINKYPTKWDKQKASEDRKEEELIKKAKYSWGQYIIHLGRSLRISYTCIHNGELSYLAHTRIKSYWIPERVLTS